MVIPKFVGFRKMNQQENKLFKKLAKTLFCQHNRTKKKHVKNGIENTKKLKETCLKLTVKLKNGSKYLYLGFFLVDNQT